MKWEIVDDGISVQEFVDMPESAKVGIWHVVYPNSIIPGRSYLVTIRKACGIGDLVTHPGGACLQFVGDTQVLFHGKLVAPTPGRSFPAPTVRGYNYLALYPGTRLTSITPDPLAKVDQVFDATDFGLGSAEERWQHLKSKGFPCYECLHYRPDSWSSTLVMAVESSSYPGVLMLDFCRARHGGFDCCSSQRTFAPFLLMNTCGLRGRFFKDRLGSAPAGFWNKCLDYLMRRRPW